MRIVELSAFIAAPLGGMTLAQLGAEVIRIDPIGGNMDYRRWPLADSGESLYWAGLNKGKRSIALALDTDAGRTIAQALMTAPGPDGGMFLTNLPCAPWNSHETLTAQRQDMISLRLIGNPDRSTAMDYTVNCASGFPHLTGPGAEPVNHVLPAWDVTAGLYLATGLLAAERLRLRTGKGQEIRCALADVMLATLGNLGYLADYELNGTQREPVGNRLYGAFGADFATADGERVMIVAISARQWHNIVQATETAGDFAGLSAATGYDLGDEGDRYRAHDAIATILTPWFARHTLFEIQARLDRHRVIWGPYRTISQLMEVDPRCSLANPLFQRVEQPSIGGHLVPGSPLAFEAVRRQPLAPAPQLGADTNDVLRDVLGISEREIADLHRGGIVAGMVKAAA